MEKVFHKIKLCELKDFINSNEFIKLEEKPLSIERAQSYLNNPHAKPNDIVLYLIRQGSTLIAYRTLLPDDYGTPPMHFAWFSGNYVNPNFRRQGFSQKLLKEVMQDWDNKLMFTNYAPISHKIYQKLGSFNNISTREGGSFYLKFSAKKILYARTAKALRWLLPLLDVFIHTFVELKLRLRKKHTFSPDINIYKRPDKEFLRRFDNREMIGFNRNVSDLEWIVNFPWITENSEKQNYFFSYTAKQFYYRYILIGTNDFALLKLRDGHLSIPYFSASNKEVLNKLSKFIIAWSVKYKISHFTTYDEKLYRTILEQKHPFIIHKQKTQNVFASWNIVPSNPKCNDGTGDYIFT